jgi:hypothetical protein
VAAAVDVVPGVAPSVIGSAAASADVAAAWAVASIAPVVVGADGVVMPAELDGVGAGAPDGRADAGL